MANRLSRWRAFLLKVAETGDSAPENATGRVEHIESGRTARFHSAEECFRFVTRTLEGKERNSQREPDS